MVDEELLKEARLYAEIYSRLEPEDFDYIEVAMVKFIPTRFLELVRGSKTFPEILRDHHTKKLLRQIRQMERELKGERR